MTRPVTFTGELPASFSLAVEELKDDLGISPVSENGWPVRLQKGRHLAIDTDKNGAVVTSSRIVECYRGLSLLFQQEERPCFHLCQSRCFKTAGIMFDVSRNAVLKPETLRFYLRKMALMGLDLGMMYTEDTYEVPSYPYLGYLRGRYTQSELCALDDYAFLFGIELCPCIQTLGHLNRALHWPSMEHMKDTEEVLLVGAAETYAFIRALLEEASRPYRSRRIHIGMDEAHFLGQGNYLRLHGYRSPFDIMKEHLNHIRPILQELGLEAMMWSDMYFRMASPTRGYYDSPSVDPAVVSCVPADIMLIYWDYYHQTEEQYESMFEKHTPFPASVGFACGIWTWTGPAPDYQKTLDTMLPGLRQAKKHRIDFVLSAAWGDNGAESNLLTSLYALCVYAEFNYTGDYRPEETGRRFSRTIGVRPEIFLHLTDFNQLPGVKNWNLRPVNAAKFLLYQDPLIQLFEKDLEGIDMKTHYAQLEKRYLSWQNEGTAAGKASPLFQAMLDFYVQLARVLTVKCQWHQEAGPCIRAKNRKKAAALADTARQTAELLRHLRKFWFTLWNLTNKPHGFEIIDLRISGIAGRMETAALVMEQFAAGTLDTIMELEEQPLAYTVLPDGALKGSYAWGEIASACKLDI